MYQSDSKHNSKHNEKLSTDEEVEKRKKLDILTNANLALYGFARYILNSKGLSDIYDPEELISEAQIRAQQYINKGKPINCPPAWLRKTMLNIVSEWRRSLKEKKLPSYYEDKEPDRRSASNPEHYIQSEELLDFMKQTLSEPAYTIVYQHYFEDELHGYIAKYLNDRGFKNVRGKQFTADSVRQIKKRAVDKLKKKLK